MGFYLCFYLCIILGIAIYYCIVISIYNKTTYKKITHNSYFSMRRNKGKRGEYEIYKELKHYETEGYSFLFNVYLTKNNDKTTELDVMMIGPEGVFVFESKNYSGWIFGNDGYTTWTQVLPTGRGRGNSKRTKFYNPIWQNRTHCMVLKDYLPKDIPIYSVVLFSNRCTFRDVTVNSNDVVLAHLFEADGLVRNLIQTSSIHSVRSVEIYNNLYQFTQVSDDIKQAHIDNINALK